MSPSGFIYGEEGRAGKLYRVQYEGATYALKVFWPKYQETSIHENTKQIERYKNLPGLKVASRTVLIEDEYGELIQEYPELKNAVMMPWIEGRLWFNYLDERTVLSREQSLHMANDLAVLLGNLEFNGLAHCDIASKNVIIGKNGESVQLLDIEEMYGPKMVPPPQDCIPAGAPGYQHPEIIKFGSWNRYADRFAGGVTLAEILGWSDERVRELTFEDGSYFEPEEMQKDCERYNILLMSLREIYGGGVSDLFERTWNCPGLSDLPLAVEWAAELIDLMPNLRVNWIISDAIPETNPVPDQPDVIPSPPKESIFNSGIEVFILKPINPTRGDEYKLYAKENDKFSGYIKEDGTLTDGINPWDKFEISQGVGFTSGIDLVQWGDENGLKINDKEKYTGKKGNIKSDTKFYLIAIIGVVLIGIDIAAISAGGTGGTGIVLGLAMLITVALLKTTE